MSTNINEASTDTFHKDDSDDCTTSLSGHSGTTFTFKLTPKTSSTSDRDFKTRISSVTNNIQDLKVCNEYQNSPSNFITDDVLSLESSDLRPRSHSMTTPQSEYKLNLTRRFSAASTPVRRPPPATLLLLANNQRLCISQTDRLPDFDMLLRRSSDSDMLIFPPTYQNASIARLSLHDQNVRQAWSLAQQMRDVGIILSLSKGIVTFCTPSVHSSLNISYKEILQLDRPFTDLVHPRDLRKFQSVNTALLCHLRL